MPSFEIRRPFTEPTSEGDYNYEQYLSWIPSYAAHQMLMSTMATNCLHIYRITICQLATLVTVTLVAAVENELNHGGLRVFTMVAALGSWSVYGR